MGSKEEVDVMERRREDECKVETATVGNGGDDGIIIAVLKEDENEGSKEEVNVMERRREDEYEV